MYNDFITNHYITVSGSNLNPCLTWQLHHLAIPVLRFFLGLDCLEVPPVILTTVGSQVFALVVPHVCRGKLTVNFLSAVKMFFFFILAIIITVYWHYPSVVFAVAALKPLWKLTDWMIDWLITKSSGLLTLKCLFLVAPLAHCELRLK